MSCAAGRAVAGGPTRSGVVGRLCRLAEALGFADEFEPFFRPRGRVAPFGRDVEECRRRWGHAVPLRVPGDGGKLILSGWKHATLLGRDVDCLNRGWWRRLGAPLLFTRGPRSCRGHCRSRLAALARVFEATSRGWRLPQPTPLLFAEDGGARRGSRRKGSLLGRTLGRPGRGCGRRWGMPLLSGGGGEAS